MPYNYDQEEQAYGVSKSVSERAIFITRTYMHLLAAIVLFTLIEIAFFKSGIAEQFSNFVFSSGNMMWLGILGGFMVISYIATMFASAESSKATQYLGLGLYVLGYSVLFLPMLWIAEALSVNSKNGSIIANAAAITLVGFAGLTAVVFITRKDFSFLRGILLWAGVVALIAIVTSAIFGFELGNFFSIAMIAFAGAAILYDTSNVLHKYPTTHYVAASVSLFGSLAMLFWYVLRLLISMSSSD